MFNKVCPFAKIINANPTQPSFNCSQCFFQVLDNATGKLECSVILSAGYGSKINSTITKG